MASYGVMSSRPIRIRGRVVGTCKQVAQANKGEPLPCRNNDEYTLGLRAKLRLPNPAENPGSRHMLGSGATRKCLQ